MTKGENNVYEQLTQLFQFIDKHLENNENALLSLEEQMNGFDTEMEAWEENLSSSEESFDKLMDEI